MTDPSAIHEAGHAVIGRILGMICGGASIVADDDSAGHSICADPLEIAPHWRERGRYRETKVIFRGRILTYMAGAESERVIVGSCDGGDGDDRYQIELMAESDDADLPLDLWRRYEPRARRHCRRLVRRHRKTIEAVANLLMLDGRLTASEIDAVMADWSLYCAGGK